MTTESAGLVLRLAIFLLPLFIAQASARNCNRSCGIKTVPYPLGFSSGCDVRLNCTDSGMFIGEFPVQSVNADEITVSIAASCNRSVQTFFHLFSHHFAPTSRNAILLGKCTAPALPCTIPATLVQTHFESSGCDANNSTINCYTERSPHDFIDYVHLTAKSCQYFVSSISAENDSSLAVSLEVQVVKLGWWLEGACQCSINANCTALLAPMTGRPSFRCRCNEGYEGDGFRAGEGCRKVSSACNPKKYMSGQCGGTTRVAVLIGGLAAGAFMMIVVGLICCFIRRRSKLKARHSAKRRLSEATGNCSIPIYAYKEIEKATNSFSEKQRLGTGAYGTVYAGKLHSDHEWVAIKRIKHRDTDSIEQVMNEIKLLSSVSHPNLVRLLGCSIEHGEQVLVYEFMPNGTLCQHLQKERGDGLSWQVRLTIATETAQAIAHLHSAIKPPIYHRDIKSSNILLDYDFKSKVADFGLSRLGMTEISHISTAPQGTPGYLDPQYHQCFHLSDKSDVYSFGVVLVEIITASKVVDFSRPPEEVNLAALAVDKIGKGCLDEIVDPFLEPQSDAWTLSSVHKVAELAFRCLAYHQDMRPSMMEVAAELERIRLSRWEHSEEKYSTASSDVSSSSCSSNTSEKPLSLMVKKAGMETRGLIVPQIAVPHFNSLERVRDNSPVSVQDPWLSEQSSPSSSSLLNNVIQ
ncbi:wall-associated receptor kinase-like 14 [Juglans microcarpa x Juglans regia]|uniref:wall-associated receptor kinase-like 14 n=1 Tax=Juglans microcarpa x Juglans regia TaxID=2249226 RepID=UPI001B7E0A12|nr:wall-associated receptor kinase-like 14 [Juglans microcarpa x Juglans regia]